jgi:hypothetical protein
MKIDFFDRVNFKTISDFQTDHTDQLDKYPVRRQGLKSKEPTWRQISSLGQAFNMMEEGR